MSKKGEKSNQLTDVENYNVKRMIFSEPVPGSIPNSVITCKRIYISTLNNDGSVGDLLLPTEPLFSFGVSENKTKETDANGNVFEKITGYVLPLCLNDRDGVTPSQQKWVDTFDAIVEHCKKHLIKNREEIERYDLEMAELKKFNPIYRKNKKGQAVPPVLYAKLIESKKQGKILSMFFDKNGQEIDPMSLVGKYCRAKCAIKIESIFIGKNICLQAKLYEAECDVMQQQMKSLLRPDGQARPEAQQRVKMGTSTNMNDVDDDDDVVVDDDDAGSINDEEEKEVVQPVKPRRKVKSVKRSVE